MKRSIAICLLSFLSLPVCTVGMTSVVMLLVAAPVVAAADDTGGSESAHDHDSDAEHDAGDHEHGDHDAASSHGGDEHGEGEHAEADHGPGILSFDFGSAFWNLVIFLCVLGILSTFVWPSVLGGLQAREDKIREDLESAEEANTNAQSLLADYQTKLDEASGQVKTMLADSRRDAEASGQKIVEQAKIEAAAQRERAVADIENAKKVALADLAGQTSHMAMQVARSVVGRELSEDDHADLIRQAMERLPSQN